MSDGPKWNVEQVSLRNGFWFYFVDGEHKITAFGAAGSGKEVIFVDDERVSEKRTLGMKSKHQFAIAEDQYEVQLAVTNLFTGAVECTVIKNGMEFDRSNKAYLTSQRKLNPYVRWMVIAIGAALGFWIGNDLWK